MQFNFSDLKDFAKWLSSQAAAKELEATSNRNVRAKADCAGEARGYKTLAKMINDGNIVIGPTVKNVMVQNEEQKEQRPSGANSEFLQHVRNTYGTKVYREMCNLVETVGEEEARLALARQQGKREHSPAIEGGAP